MIACVRHNLSDEKPIQFSGNHHSIVCDGIDDDDLIHLNFGWNGYMDGYYDMYSSDYCQEAITDIKPIQELQLFVSDINCAENVVMGMPLGLSCTIINNSTNSFSGSITPSLCDAHNTIISVLSPVDMDLYPGESRPVYFEGYSPTILLSIRVDYSSRRKKPVTEMAGKNHTLTPRSR